MADPTTCTLQNNTRGILTVNLPHGIVPDFASMRFVGRQTYEVNQETKNGKTFTEVVRKPGGGKKPVSGSLTFLASGKGSKHEGLPREVLFAPEVDQAIKAKRLLLIGEPELPKAATAEPSAPVSGGAPAFGSGQNLPPLERIEKQPKTPKKD